MNALTVVIIFIKNNCSLTVGSGLCGLMLLGASVIHVTAAIQKLSKSAKSAKSADGFHVNVSYRFIPGFNCAEQKQVSVQQRIQWPVWWGEKRGNG